MAKQKGIIKLEGTLGELTFYRSQDGNLVRTKGGVSGDRIANDPTFIRTRENGAEFGSAASAGKLLRDTVRTLMQNASDNRVTSRLTKVMTQIKDFDTTSARGERNVFNGLSDPDAVQLLKGFDFNNRAILGAVMYGNYSVNLGSGVITIPGFDPVNDLAYPAGATHVSIRSAFAIINFQTGAAAIEYSPVSNMAIAPGSSTLTLTPAATPAGSGSSFYLLMIEFFQEVNGVQYSLKNGAYNVLTIVDAQ